MTTVLSASEYAELTGADLGLLEECIREAEADSITRDELDPSTFSAISWSPEADERFRTFLSKARGAACNTDGSLR